MQYKVSIPEDIPHENRNNICQLIQNSGLYNAQLSADFLSLEKIDWPDFYQHTGTIDIHTENEELRLIADKCFAWGPQPTIDRNVLTVLGNDRNRLETDGRSQSLLDFITKVHDIFTLSSKQQLFESLEVIKRVFFDRFTKGQILFIKKPAMFALLERTPSVLAGLQFLSAEDIDELISADRPSGVFGTFQKGHFLLTRDFLAPGLQDTSGASYGFSVHWLSHQFIFLFGEKENIKSSEESKKVNKAYGIDSLNEMWSDIKPDIPFTAHYTPNQAKEYFLWYLKGINRMLTFLLDSTNFRYKNTDEIVVKDQFYALMTFDAMSEILLRCNISNNNLAKKLLFFDFLDRFTGLLGYNGCSSIFTKKYFKKHVLDRYIGLSGSLRLTLIGSAKKDFTNLFDGILNGIYQPSRHSRGVVRMGRKGETIVSSHIYFQSFIANLRDTTHGYPLKSDKFTNFFAIHSGRISHILPRMATYLFHGLISNPSLSLEKRYNNLNTR